MRKTYTLNINQFIGEENKKKKKEKQKELLQIIDDEERILLVANPGVGKTTFASELMKIQKSAGNRFVYSTFLTIIPKQLNDTFNFDLVCSSSEMIWKARTDSTILGDDLLYDNELVIGTTLHQLDRFIEELNENDVIVIDEAHQLVQLADRYQINSLREKLKNTPAKLILMTGTPYDKEAERFNLTVVDVQEKNPRVDKLVYIPITEELKKKTNVLDLTCCIVQWYLFLDDKVAEPDENGHTFVNAETKKVLIYNNSAKIDNEALSERLYEEFDLRFSCINAEKKETSAYKNLVNDERIEDHINGIITTSVIKEGINIRNQDIDVVIVLGHHTTKDEKQIAKRIRGNKPLEIFRIFEEPDKNKIDKVDFEIDLVTFLVESYKNHPDKLKKRLRMLARCGEILRSTSILDKNAQTINEVKTQDVFEQLNAQKQTLDDFLKLHPYNDLKPYDGRDYLEEKYEFFFPDHDLLGDFTDNLAEDKVKIKKERLDELKTIMQTLFGNSSNLQHTIQYLKGDLLNYNNVGFHLSQINYLIISTIRRSGYLNEQMGDDPTEGLSEKEKKELLLNTVKFFSSKFRDEMIAVVKILVFLTKHADDVEDILPVLTEAIPVEKIEWTAKRFELSDRLNEINKKLDKTVRRGSEAERAAITEESDLIRFHIMRQIESHITKYKYVYRPMLQKYVQNKYGDSQYMKSLRLNVDEELTLYIHAMGVTEDNISWKKSAQNKTRFDQLWKDSGRPGIPPLLKGIKVYSCKLSTPSELIDHYFENI